MTSTTDEIRERRLRAGLSELAAGARTDPTRPLRLPAGPTPTAPVDRPAVWRAAAVLVAVAAVVGGLVAIARRQSPTPTTSTNSVSTAHPSIPAIEPGTTAVDSTQGTEGTTTTSTAPPSTAPPSTAPPSTAVPPTEPAATHYFTDLGPDSVAALPPAPISGRVGPASVWTGTEFIVWGGDEIASGDARDVEDGAAFDPVTGSWRVLARAPIKARLSPVAAWTGKEMIVWGGTIGSTTVGDGAAYNPATDSWRTIADSPLEPAVDSGSVWTGTEMLIVGGVSPDAERGQVRSRSGAAYNPATDSWRPIASAPAPLTTPYAQMVWTGTHALTVLEPDLVPPTNVPEGTVAQPSFQLILATYAPSTDSWETVTDDFYRLLVATPGGSSALPEQAAVALAPMPGVASLALDASGKTIGTLAARPPDAEVPGQQFSAGVWDGREVLVWSGGYVALALDPARNVWRTFPAGDIVARVEQAMVWADGVLLAWGGWVHDAAGNAIGGSDGVIYRPPAANTTADITRPYVDPSICTHGTKTVSDASDAPFTVYPFAHGWEAPVPIQIIGSATGGPAQPFAVLIRYFSNASYHAGGRTVVDINGLSVGITTFDNGNGNAQWELPDGSNAYLRTRGLDAAAIESIVRGLTPRDRSATIPGFDYRPDPNDSTAASGFTLIDESLNTEFGGRSSSSAAHFTCTTTNGNIYRIDALQGDPVIVYLGVIDRATPLQVANNGGGALVISGRPAETAPTIADVTNAAQSTWDELPITQGY